MGVPEVPAVRGRDETLREEVKAVLESPAGLKLVEATVVEFAVDRKVQDVIDRYLRTRVYPAVLTAAAVLGVLGWGLDKQLSVARDGIDAQLKVVEERRRMIDAKLGNLDDALDAARQSMKLLELEAKMLSSHLRGEAEEQRKSVERVSKDADTWRREARTQIQNEVDAVAALRQRAAVAEFRFSAVDERIQELRKTTELGTAEATRLRSIADLQGRVIGAAVIEFLTMRSDTRSAVIDLPTANRSYKLQFETTNIKERFDLIYRIDGSPHRLTVSNADKTNWYPLVGTEGRYEFRVDHVFHGAGPEIRDFVTLRVRSSGSLVADTAGGK
jgi:hypothetical protein